MILLNIFSNFAAATTLLMLFLSKIASCLKFRKKIQLKQQGASTTVTKENLEKEEPFLEMATIYIYEMEKIVKNKEKWY